MEIKTDILKNFDLGKISNELLQLGKASLGIFAKAYVRQTQLDIQNEKYFTPRTGLLAKSIQTLEIDYGFAIKVPLEYGLYLEEGTRPHIIKAKQRKVLKIPNPVGTGYIFRKKVQHPGIQERGWFIGAFEERSQIANEAMKAYFKRGLEMLQKGEI